MNRNDDPLELALDELRMQMLGAQVLFGFQFHGLFQPGFDATSAAQRTASAAAFISIVSTLALLIAAPCMHRLAERGEATSRMRQYAARCAEGALVTLSLTLACDIFLVVGPHFGTGIAWTAALATLSCSGILWYGLAVVNRPARGTKVGTVQTSGKNSTPLHSKIDYLLTEARVILPGAQALLGFQLIVTMTRRFAALSAHLQAVHFAGLGLITLTILLLIAPAALHRLAFGGDDGEQFLTIGSRIVTLALLPLALGIAADLYIAASMLYPGRSVGLIAGAGSLALLLLLWYAIPCWLRQRNR